MTITVFNTCVAVCGLVFALTALVLAVISFIKVSIIANSKHEVHLIKDTEMFSKNAEAKEKLEDMNNYNNEFYEDLNMPNPHHMNLENRY